MTDVVENKTDTKSIIEFIMLSSIKYMYELGSKVAEKYSLEKDITQINRIIELIFTSMVMEDDIDINRYYLITKREFSSYNRLSLELKEDLKKLKSDIDGKVSLDLDLTMQAINNSFLLIDPSFKKTSKKWEEITWPNINVEAIVKDMNLSNDVPIELEEFLPTDVLDSIQSDEGFIRKKKELVENIEFLKAMKEDLGQVLLNLLPENKIIN